MWYLRRGIILTKDNLVKRNWTGNTTCCFCHHEETITHLFFRCKFTRATWSIIQVASNLYPPRSMANLFGNWLQGVDHKSRMLIRVGAAALFWSLWLVEMIQFLMVITLLLCRLSTSVRTGFVRGLFFNARNIATSVQWLVCH